MDTVSPPGGLNLAAKCQNALARVRRLVKGRGMLFAPFAGEKVCRRVPMPRPFDLRTTPNVEPRYALDEAAWLWHPEIAADEGGLVLFRLEINVAKAETVTLQVSADLCFTLALDGALIARGPDTGDVNCWSASAYEVRLAAGRRRLEALVWWDHLPVAPVGRASWRAGFACAGVGAGGERFTTGKAKWRVARLDAVTHWGMPALNFYHVIGGAARIDAAKLSVPAADWRAPAVARAAMQAHATGLVTPGWQLRPSALPEQQHEFWRGGSVRAFLPTHSTAELVRFGAEAPPAETKDWDALLRGEKELRLPAGYRATLLIDTGDYLCGYPRVQAVGGAGTQLRWQWTEALRETEKHDGAKGDRAVVAHKWFHGFGDSWQFDGKSRWLSTPWWRSGQYWRLDVCVGAKPLRLQALGIDRTGYPLQSHHRFDSDDRELEQVNAICELGLRSCMHEVYVDCPYYEQMMYGADTRVQMLVNHVVSRDDRLVRRGIELFAWSRGLSGLSTMRYPARDRQESATFAMIWPWMLRDYAWWRDDLAWVHTMAPVMRGLVEALDNYADDTGLLVHPPGWLFVDWVPQWSDGWAPGTQQGRRSALVNFEYLLALQAAEEVEEALGEPLLAERWRKKAVSVARAMPRAFWSAKRGLWADDESLTGFSQHAQAFAIIAGLRAPKLSRWSDATKAGIIPATIQFQHYTFEAFGLLARGDLVMADMALWRGLVKKHALTPEENPEINRSECHAWGSHPLFHLHATIAGVRPAAPGFAQVRIAPQPGDLREINTVLPHPRGEIKLNAKFDGVRVVAEVSLPKDVTGEFVWRGQTRKLRGGAQCVRL